MNEIIKMIVMEKDRIGEVSIYMSIIIAYFEMQNWEDAQKILLFIEPMDMPANERSAYFYLSHLCQSRDQENISALVEYLSYS